eukprot:15464219-Alexandrium_andersonii.AAC.1
MSPRTSWAPGVTCPSTCRHPSSSWRCRDCPECGQARRGRSWAPWGSHGGGGPRRSGCTCERGRWGK